MLDADLSSVATQKLSTWKESSALFTKARRPMRSRAAESGTGLGDIQFKELTGVRSAVQVGKATMVIEGDGKVGGVLPCTQVVDDGTRLWCDAAGGTTLYNYKLTKSGRTFSGVRMATSFAGDAGQAPVLIDSGQVVRVDPDTGEKREVDLLTGGGTPGTDDWPTATPTQSGWVVADGEIRSLINNAGRVKWTVESAGRRQATWADGRMVFLDEDEVDVFDVSTGNQVAFSIDQVFDVFPNGADFFAVGTNEVSGQDLP